MMVSLADFVKNHFPVGLFSLAEKLWTDEGVKYAAETGADFLVSVQSVEPLLSLCDKYSLGIISTSNLLPFWWGGDGANAGEYAQQFPVNAMDKVKENYPQSPRVWGDYQVDEPNVDDFEHIGNIIRKYSQLFPEKLFFMNLYPCYGSIPKNTADEIVTQLGCSDFSGYIDRYVQQIDLPYICFDYYPYTGANVFATYLENLDTVAKACIKSNREMWVIMQTGAWKAEEILEEHQIAWQVYLSLAYGAKAIIHACYSHVWWDPSTSFVNAEGEKNPTYDYVKSINSVLHSDLGTEILKYEYTGTAVFGEINESNEKVRVQLEKQNERSGLTGIPDITIDSTKAVVAGFFKNNDRFAVMVVNSHDPFDASVKAEVHLSMKNYKAVEVFGIEKNCAFDTASQTGTNTRIKLSSGHGALVIFKVE